MSLFTNLTCSTNIPAVLPQEKHPMPPPDNTNNAPVQTNKFYTNMLLDKRTLYAYPQPYSVWWTGNGVNGYNGLGVSHQDASARTFGPNAGANPTEYFFMPSGVMMMCVGASFGGNPTFSTSAWGPLSVTATLTYNSTEVEYPLASGMGFVTAIYRGLAPQISSQVGFKSVTQPVVVRTGVTRVNCTLNNNQLWSVYVCSPTNATATISQTDGNHISVHTTESGVVVQLAKLGDASWQSVIDGAAGSYPTQVSIDGGTTNDRSTATYALQYNLSGACTAGGTLLYAAPHHVESFTSTMNGKVTDYYLASPALGNLRLCVATELEMYEKLPTQIGFLPWSVNKTEGDANFNYNNFSYADKQQLVQIAEHELNNVDIGGATNLTSMYFSGKAFSKYANILLVLAYIAKDTDLAKSLLAKLKTAFSTFVNNKQQTPLFYDQSWRGLVSQAGIKNSMADFGNTYYNDHHFHYGYFVHSAAIIGKVDQDLGDKSWASNSANKDWVNTLIRDSATYGSDTTYPESRNFDWYSGHSYAKGLFVSADGKDEESSSEDYNFYYGMKLWASVIGDQAMESRANLILAIETRSINHYMLFTSNNTTMPANFIANKVAGITFENKVDHTTYFGNLTQYIQGIHMIPITPISSYFRSPTFVKEEWDTILSKIINNVNDGWKGLLMLNYALYDPKTAYSFFADSNFNDAHLDGGMSRTWALAFCKALL